MPSNSLKETLDIATQVYHRALLEGAGNGGQYLVKRGLSRDSAIYFQLGVVDNPLPGHERYEGMLAVPYLTPSGVVDIRFRCCNCFPEKCDGHPKTLGMPGQMLRPYNVLALHEPSDIIAIAEGEPDTWVTHQAGIPVLGLPGVASIKDYTSRLFVGYSRVLILADNNDAGQGSDFADRLADSIDNAAICLMPSGHDVNSFVLSGGDLRERLGLE